MRMAGDRSSMTENTSRGLLILILLFVILTGVILVFSQSFIKTIASGDPIVATIALVIAIVLPLTLLVVIIFQFVRLLRQRARQAPGAGLRLRLLLFFALVSLLSSVPQAMLGITFVNSAMGTWFSSSIGDALKGARELAVDYQSERRQNLSSFMEGQLLADLVRSLLSSPRRAWSDIQAVNAGIAALQVFSADGASLAFQGDARARLTRPPEEAGGTEDRADASILRKSRIITVDGQKLTVVGSALLPATLRANVRRISQSLTVFTTLDQFGGMFRLVMVSFFFLFSLPLFFITILVSFLLTGRIIQPIAHLEDATRRVAEGDFSFRILTRPRDEFANLVDSFNGMVTELERSRRKLLQAERITAWQEIAQRLAHEIRNPLTPIKLSAQRIVKKHDEKAEDFDRVLAPAVSSIITEVENLERMLREFGDFAKLPVPMPAPTPLREMLEEVASVYTNLSAAVRVDLRDVPEALVLGIDRGQMKRVFANLFTNAIQAMPNGGLLSVRASIVKKTHTSFCRIAVTDTGTGIPEKDLDSIFDPYFTSKKNGTGLGLAIVQRIVFDHKGNVWAESDGSSGATFFIDLPTESTGGHQG
jgi:two-component system, NtrC family, nitrogen regulation sensor histidine kinase NtrY